MSYAASAGSAVSNLISPLLNQSTNQSTNQSKSINPSDLARDMDRYYHVRVRPLLDAVDQLRGLLQSEPIQLPSIVVVGDQSSGKSSVLEALSGVSLPRGQNITTRCPLVLRLVNLTADSGKDSNQQVAQSVNQSANQSTDPPPYAYLTTTPIPSSRDQRITNLAEIGPQIQQLTSRIAGSNAGVVSTPIYLSVYRAHSPDLTLVDLPGITRNPIGDQPKDIYNQIRAMIMHYIEPASAVILCVMPATVDLTTCECVQLSKQVDPACERTIGVITKLDCAERGIRRKLEVSVAQLDLALGVVAVRNRSAEENDRGVEWEQAREMERVYFRNHPELASLADQEGHDGNHDFIPSPLMLGTSALAQLLTTIQEQKIRASLPFIRGNIRELLSEHRNKLAALPPTVTGYAECRMRADSMLSSFRTQLSALARGDHSIAKGDNRMHMSPRLNEIYLTYQQALDQSSSNHLTYEFARQVEDEIKENSGITLPNFLSSQVFDSLMSRELAKTHSPSVMAVDQVRSVLGHILLTLVRSAFKSYPALVLKMTSVVNAWLDERQRVLLSRVEESLAQECEMFTQNAYYLDIVSKIKGPLYERLYGGSPAERESRERAAERRAAERERAIQGEQNSNNPGGHSAQSSRGGRGSWMSAFTSVPQIVAPAVSHNQSNNQSSNQSHQQQPPTSTVFTFSVNDLQVTVDLASVTLPLSASQAALAQSNAAGLSSLIPSNSILDMQINCYAYTIIARKRLADTIPLSIRYHFVKSLVGGHLPILAQNDGAGSKEDGTSNSLVVRMQRELYELGDKGLTDAMREDKDIAAKRDRLKSSVSKLEKSLQVLESL